MENHIVIFGWNPFTVAIVEQLVKAGKSVLIISENTSDQEEVQRLFPKKLELMVSRHHSDEELREANLEKSSVVLVNLGDDTRNLMLMINLKKRFEKSRFVVPIEKTELKETFKNAGVTYPLSKYEIGAKLFSSYLFEKDVATYFEDLLDTAVADEEQDIKQYRVSSSNPYIGQRYADVFMALKKDFNAVLIGISKVEGHKRVLYKNPYQPLDIEENDHLILIVNGRTARLIAESFGTEEGRL